MAYLDTRNRRESSSLIARERLCDWSNEKRLGCRSSIGKLADKHWLREIRVYHIIIAHKSIIVCQRQTMKWRYISFGNTWLMATIIFPIDIFLSFANRIHQTILLLHSGVNRSLESLSYSRFSHWISHLMDCWLSQLQRWSLLFFFAFKN